MSVTGLSHPMAIVHARDIMIMSSDVIADTKNSIDRFSAIFLYWLIFPREKT